MERDGLSPRLRGPGRQRCPCHGYVRVIPAPAGTSSLPWSSPPARSGYPRACGDQFAGLKPSHRGAGLSPRLRGPEPRRKSQAPNHRVIPAPAGTRPGAQIQIAHSSGYPRACGDQFSPPIARPANRGLSPRLRGPARQRPGVAAVRRVIPAPAGTSEPHRPGCRPPSGYPRACGDQIAGAAAGGMYHGLSPRLRGPAHHLPPGGRHIRVIPAPAGTSPPSARESAPAAGYPRACGDQRTRRPKGRISTGLSPRLRGPGEVLQKSRLIKTGYPRACGDQVGQPGAGHLNAGLSPRLRGPAGDLRHGHQHLRVIPAPAGTSSSWASTHPLEAGYPRACGDQRPTKAVSGYCSGLSPRLRGPVHLGARVEHRNRVIPAPAGTRHGGRGR